MSSEYFDKRFFVALRHSRQLATRFDKWLRIEFLGELQSTLSSLNHGFFRNINHDQAVVVPGKASTRTWRSIPQAAAQSIELLRAALRDDDGTVELSEEISLFCQNKGRYCREIKDYSFGLLERF